MRGEAGKRILRSCQVHFVGELRLDRCLRRILHLI